MTSGRKQDEANAAGMEKVKISVRALVQRINRALRAKDELLILKTSRGTYARGWYGKYYVLDRRRNSILDKHVSIDTLGREMGVLQDYEELG